MPSLSCFPWMNPWRVARLAYKAGFGGVEWLLAGRAMRDPSRCLTAADRWFYMESTFHEAWTAKESTTPSVVWNALQFLGWLPKSTVYGDHVPNTIGNHLVVAYANHIVMNHVPANVAFQTCSVADGRGRFAISFEEFVRELRRRTEAKVVLDTYHMLEWMTGTPDGLSVKGPDWFLGKLKDFFDEFQGRIVEIHVADWSPTKGRNCLIGTGILPLREFGRHVAQSKWDGNVVPEVDPRWYLFNKGERLRFTCLITRDHFRSQRY